MQLTKIASACLLFAATPAVLGAECPDDPEMDLCDQSDETPSASGGIRSQTLPLLTLLLPGSVASTKLSASLLFLSLLGEASAAENSGTTTCGHVKDLYKAETCCGSPDKEVGWQIVPNPPKTTRLGLSANPCQDKKPSSNAAFDNKDCFLEGVINAIEQSGGDVSEGVTGEMVVDGRVPMNTSYFKGGLCPVNVHWHLGSEHRSAGQYDESGTSPNLAGTPATALPADGAGRRLGDDDVRYGFACQHYNADDSKFTTPYDWLHCVGMHVGETYEVHWPHSAIGACHTPHQFQSPFYDGVFCGITDEILAAVTADNAQGLVNAVGVQAQVFTIVNDETYYYPDLMRGAIVDGDMWSDVIAYTGSTTGTSRSNTICSSYTPITWQVDRKCHLISASTFDKMCADMKQQADDMSSDLHAHGARMLVSPALTANNQAGVEDYPHPTR